MTDIKFVNGKLLAEALKKEFSNEFEVNIADVKDVSPEKIAFLIKNGFIKRKNSTLTTSDRRSLGVGSVRFLNNFQVLF